MLHFKWAKLEAMVSCLYRNISGQMGNYFKEEMWDWNAGGKARPEVISTEGKVEAMREAKVALSASPQHLTTCQVLYWDCPRQLNGKAVLTCSSCLLPFKSQDCSQPSLTAAVSSNDCLVLCCFACVTATRRAVFKKPSAVIKTLCLHPCSF